MANRKAVPTTDTSIGVTNTLANGYGQGRPGLPENPPSGLMGLFD